MRKYQNTFLAGVAALALVAGAGLASAQDQSRDHASPSTPNAANPAMKTDKDAATKTQRQPEGKAGQAAENKNQGADQTAKENVNKGADANAKAQHAQDVNRTRKGGKENQAAQPAPKQNGATAQQQQQPGKKGAATAEEQRRLGRRMTAQQQREERSRMSAQRRQAERNGTLKGLQGNASKQFQGNNGAQGNAEGANVQLSPEQRTRIRETVIDARGAPRVGHVDFDVRVGAAIPRGRIHIVPVPETLVRIEPRWRGYLYFVYEDEIVVVNPRSMRIVAVLPV